MTGNSYLTLSLFALAFTHGLLASGQQFPNRPVRIITAQAGGSQDLGARLMAAELTPMLGQQVIVENRSGGTIGGETVAKAPPDGQTLIYTGSIFWTYPLTHKNTPYDVLRDFAPITQGTREPLVLVVHPSLPVKSVRELIALAKARPGQLNYGTGGIGSSNHIAAELFDSMAKVKIVGVQYRGVGQSLVALMAGEVQVMIATSVGPYMKSGKLRALAVTFDHPTPLYPGLPTVAATLPGYETAQNAGMFAPARTPAAIINRLNHDIVTILHRPDVKAKFMSDGVETVGGTPEELTALLKSEITRIGKIMKEAGIVPE